MSSETFREISRDIFFEDHHPRKDAARLTKEAYQAIKPFFLDERLDRWNREAILITLVEDMSWGNGVKDLKPEQAQELVGIIRDIMRESFWR